MYTYLCKIVDSPWSYYVNLHTGCQDFCGPACPLVSIVSLSIQHSKVTASNSISSSSSSSKLCIPPQNSRGWTYLTCHFSRSKRIFLSTEKFEWILTVHVYPTGTALLHLRMSQCAVCGNDDNALLLSQPLSLPHHRPHQHTSHTQPRRLLVHKKEEEEEENEDEEEEDGV